MQWFLLLLCLASQSSEYQSSFLSATTSGGFPVDSGTPGATPSPTLPSFMGAVGLYGHAGGVLAGFLYSHPKSAYTFAMMISKRRGSKFTIGTRKRGSKHAKQTMSNRIGGAREGMDCGGDSPVRGGGQIAIVSSESVSGDQRFWNFAARRKQIGRAHV